MIIGSTFQRNYGDSGTLKLSTSCVGQGYYSSIVNISNTFISQNGNGAILCEACQLQISDSTFEANEYINKTNLFVGQKLDCTSTIHEEIHLNHVLLNGIGNTNVAQNSVICSSKVTIEMDEQQYFDITCGDTTGTICNVDNF